MLASYAGESLPVSICLANAAANYETKRLPASSSNTQMIHGLIQNRQQPSAIDAASVCVGSSFAFDNASGRTISVLGHLSTPCFDFLRGTRNREERSCFSLSCSVSSVPLRSRSSPTHASTHEFTRKPYVTS